MSLGRQFSDIGPEEATQRGGYDLRRSQPKDDLGLAQMPLPGITAPRAEPHEQTKEQFTNDDRTWFHGRYSDRLPRIPGPTLASDLFHVGTRQAAEERLRDAGPGMHRQPGRMFPLRIGSEMKNTPESAIGDKDSSWSTRHAGKYYRNAYEDKGSVSAILPSANAALSHQQFVKEAEESGKYVRPRVKAEYNAMGGTTANYGRNYGREYDPGLTFKHPKSVEQHFGAKTERMRLFGGGNTVAGMIDPKPWSYGPSVNWSDRAGIPARYQD